MAVTHIVMLQFKPDVSSADIEKVRNIYSPPFFFFFFLSLFPRNRFQGQTN